MTDRLPLGAWERVERLFAEALDRDPGARESWLRASGEAAEVVAEVRRLLAAHDAAGDFLAPLDPGRAAALVRSVGGEGGAPETIGPYRVVRPLARGGMGIVYLAHDDRLDRDVALKILPGWLEAEPSARQRFLAEARAASRLDHPNILTVYDVGEAPGGGLYIATAYYEGETLAERIARGPLRAEEAVRIARQVAEGLAAAHRAGIVHRDIKPSNVALAPDGRARILDFGIAKGAGAKTTRAGVRLGTIAYMSPEQTRGEPLDARTDVWSFGALLYEMLAGRRPFAGDDDAIVIHAIRSDDPPALAELRPETPARLTSVIDRCLRKDPSDRYPDAAAIRTAFDGSGAPESLAADEASARTGGPRRLFAELKRRHVFRVAAVYGATAFVVLQLADIAFPALGLPESAMTLVLVLVLLGFPIAIVLAWALELTPGGIRRTEAATAAEVGEIVSLPARKRWPSGILALLGTAALLLAGAAALGWLRIGPEGSPDARQAEGVPAATPADPYRVLVLPFSAPSGDGELSRMGRDLVITLAATLDGLGELRTIDGTTVAARTAAPGTVKAAVEGGDLARELRAGRVVRGSLVRTGGPDDGTPGVRAEVAVFEAGSATAAVRATAEAPVGDIGALTDSITLALVRRLWPSDRAPSFEPHALTTRSVEALRAFLAGELATAQGRWRDAPEAFARAFALDSTFWLAGARYLDAMDYSARPVDPAFREMIWEHREALPERQRALMEAGRADSLSQLLEQTREVAERYPDSWRAWFAFADQLIHNGMFLGETQEEARAAIERAVALNPTSSTLWQHLFWMALADRDTAATRTATDRLDDLGADSTSLAEVGLDQLRLYRFLQGLAATGDEPDPAATDALARQLVDYEGPLDLSRLGGEVLAYGFPRGETALEERTLALPVPAAARRGALRSIAHALAARGAWDSALVAMDEYVAAASGSEPLLVAWRLATIGQWLGALPADAGAAWRESLARGPELDPSSRAELAWLDGVAATRRGDTQALAEAGSRLATWIATAPDGRDTVAAAHLSRSLEALSLGVAGRTTEAADALRELERDRAQRFWFRREGNAHPYLTAVNRLSAADWLLDAGRAGDAEPLLRWYESVQFPAWRAARADGTLRASIHLRRARAADALGREAEAREQRARALEALDLASGRLRAAADSARAALGL